MNDKEQHVIKVLWIDDEPQDGFRKFAFNQKQIFIEVACSVVEGLEKLQHRDNSYEAIILDANCIIKPGEVPALDALTYAIVNLYRMRIDIPWFVYTAGGERWKEVLDCLIPKDTSWLKRLYYDKPADQEVLCDDIREAVQNFRITQIKQQYSEIFHLYDGKDLIELIIAAEDNDEFGKDNSVPGKLRLIMDWICNFLSQIKLVPFEFTPAKITEHSKFIGRTSMQAIIPIYIQRLFFFLVDYSNQGNHRFLETCERIRSGRAPMLNKSAIDALITILYWIATLPFGDINKMQEMQDKAEIIYTFNEK